LVKQEAMKAELEDRRSVRYAAAVNDACRGGGGWGGKRRDGGEAHKRAANS